MQVTTFAEDVIERVFTPEDFEVEDKLSLCLQAVNTHARLSAMMATLRVAGVLTPHQWDECRQLLDSLQEIVHSAHDDVFVAAHTSDIDGEE